MVDERGEPTRLALGAGVGRGVSRRRRPPRRKLAAKGARLLEEYEALKKSATKGSKKGAKKGATKKSSVKKG